MRHLSIILTFILSLALTSISAQKYEGPQEDIDAILQNAKDFSQYYLKGDIDNIVNSYTADAKIFPTGRDVMTGSDAIRSYWNPNPNSKKLSHLLTPLEIIVTDDKATDYGYYEGTSQWKDGEPTDFKGKYLIVWKKVDGLWKMHLDMWNKIDLPREESPDAVAVTNACYDYINAWYDVDTTLAHRSVHPTLRKAGYYYKDDEKKYSDQLEMSFRNLIDYSAVWNAKGDQADENSPKRVDIFEISDKTAVAKVTAIWGIDYMSLAKLDGKWMIVNVLWQSKPR